MNLTEILDIDGYLATNVAVNLIVYLDIIQNGYSFI